MSSFVHDNSQLSDCELSQAEWRLLRDTEQFLQPFKEQTKRCEGDNVTLDQLQESIDFLIDHFERQFHRHRSNKPFIECITTGWYTTTRSMSLVRTPRPLCYTRTNAKRMFEQPGGRSGSSRAFAELRSFGQRNTRSTRSWKCLDTPPT
jgi:hypothetical protein